MIMIYGHVNIDPGESIEFPFEVEDNATSADIQFAMGRAMWESGLVDFYYMEESAEESEDDDDDEV